MDALVTPTPNALCLPQLNTNTSADLTPRPPPRIPPRPEQAQQCARLTDARKREYQAEFAAYAAVGPGRNCSPRHRVPLTSNNEGGCR
jgi:hypothetical protein